MLVQLLTFAPCTCGGITFSKPVTYLTSIAQHANIHEVAGKHIRRAVFSAVTLNCRKHDAAINGTCVRAVGKFCALNASCIDCCIMLWWSWSGQWWWWLQLHVVAFSLFDLHWCWSSCSWPLHLVLVVPLTLVPMSPVVLTFHFVHEWWLFLAATCAGGAFSFNH